MTLGQGTGWPPRACLPVRGAASPAFTGEERAPVSRVCHSTCLVLEVSLLVKLGISGRENKGFIVARGIRNLLLTRGASDLVLTL